MNKKITFLIKYLIGFIVAGGIFFLAVGLRNIYIETDLKQIYRALADGFTIPGVVFICFFLILWFSNLGSFQGIGYAMKHLISMLVPVNKKKTETYAQHIENQKKVSGYGFLFVIGGLFLLLGIVFTILFLL